MDEFLRELQNMTMQQIEERLANLDVEVRNANDVEVVNRATEMRNELLRRQAELREIQSRHSAAVALNTGNVAARMLGTFGQSAASLEGENEKSYRSAWLKQIRGLQLDDKESRAMSSASSSAGAAIPVQTSSEILKKITEKAPLLNEITLLQVSGGVTFAVEGSKGDATTHTENTTITESTDTLVSVTLAGFEVVKLVQVSETVKNMSVDAFETWLTDMIAEKVAEKITKLIMFGVGSTEAKGMSTGITWGSTNSVTVAAASSTTSENVLALIGLLPGSYDKNAKFLMSKRTLFTEFMPLQDNSKNKIVTVEGNQYYVYGYPVMKDDDIPLGEAYLGDFKKIVGNLPEEAKVVSAFDIDTNSYKFLGKAIFDSKVAITEAFVKLVKATATS